MPPTQKRQVGTWSYILRCDRNLPADQQSRFTLRAYTLAERAAAVDSYRQQVVNADGVRTAVDRDTQEMLRCAVTCIVAVDNFPSEKPQPWPSDRAARMAYLEQLHDAHVAELGSEIWVKSYPPLEPAPVDDSLPGT